MFSLMFAPQLHAIRQYSAFDGLSKQSVKIMLVKDTIYFIVN